MNAPIFRTYLEAAAFAKRRAQELGTAVTVRRSNDEWVVYLRSQQPEAITARQDNPTTPQSNTTKLSWSERMREKKRRMDAEEKSREDDERKRQIRLIEKDRYYRSLPENQLDELWHSRESEDLDSDETALLREILREAKGIIPTHGNSVRVCCQCGMVEDNCTCGRSWF